MKISIDDYGCEKCEEATLNTILSAAPDVYSTPEKLRAHFAKVRSGMCPEHLASLQKKLMKKKLKIVK